MSGASVDFRGEIRRYADERGLDLAPERIEAIDAMLKTFSIPDVEARTIAYQWANGAPATLAGILAAETATAPQRTAHKQPTSSGPAGTNKTQRAMEIVRSRSTEQAKQADAEALVRSFGNPWINKNLTRQAFITRGHPALAAKLKQEAGVR